MTLVNGSAFVDAAELSRAEAWQVVAAVEQLESSISSVTNFDKVLSEALLPSKTSINIIFMTLRHEKGKP